MQFGILLLGEHTLPHLVRLAQLAESGGVDTLWYADEKFFRDPYVSLAYLAQYTRRIKLGIAVSDPFTRHPALMAMAMATLDQASAQRTTLGLGAGFSGLEAIGLTALKPARALREAIDVMRRLWAGETMTYQGQVVSLRSCQLNFPARPDLPICIASSGRQILRLAGEIADGVMFGDMASARILTRALEQVQMGAQRAGRSLDGIPLIARANLVLSDDLTTAFRRMKPWIAVGLWDKYPKWDYYLNYESSWQERFQPLQEFAREHGSKPRNVGDHALVEPYSTLVTDEMVRDNALVGSVDQVVQQILEIAGTGVNEVTIYPMPLPDQEIESVLTQFVEKVMPRVRARLPDPAASSVLQDL